MSAAEKLEWVEVGPLAAIPPRGARTVRTAGGDIAVFRTADDHVFALDDRCPHQGGPLSQGIVAGETVTCPLHSWCLSLKTGEALAPDQGHAERYPVRVDDGTVYLSLTAEEG